jgi:hypothetical protein
MGVFVGQLNDIFAVVAERLAALGFDHNGPVSAIGFLKAGMDLKSSISAILSTRQRDTTTQP